MTKIQIVMVGKDENGNIVERPLDGSRDDYESFGRPGETRQLVLNKDL